MHESFKLYKTNTIKNLQSTTIPLKQPKHSITITPFQYPKTPQFSCINCEQNLQKVTSLKKTNILLEYQNTKLLQQIQHLTQQNKNLKKKLSQQILLSINSLGSTDLYLNIKQDLQAQIFQCKYLNQLLILSQHPKSHQNITQKYQSTLIQNIKLQQQLQQKNNIINDHVLYPIYHYDSRIKNLKDTLLYFYRIAHQQCQKYIIMIKSMKKQITNLKNGIKQEIDDTVRKYLCVNNNNNLTNITTTTKQHSFSTIHKSKKPKQLKNNSYKNQQSILNKQKIKNHKSKNKKQNKII